MTMTDAERAHAIKEYKEGYKHAQLWQGKTLQPFVFNETHSQDFRNGFRDGWNDELENRRMD